MKIECLLRREGGSVINLEGREYLFAPTKAGRHVADVEDEDHAQRFLDIPEAYRVAPDDEEPSQVVVGPSAEEIAAKARAEAEADFAKAQAEKDAQARKDADAAREAETAAERKALEERVQAGTSSLSASGKEVVHSADATAEDKAYDVAAANYIEQFGNKPHYRWTTETILSKMPGYVAPEPPADTTTEQNGA